MRSHLHPWKLALATLALTTPAAAEEVISDNSFFIEEAYNQEPRVVQHIGNLVLTTEPTDDVAFSFTQEWPFLSQKHQLSYTVPYLFLDSNADRGLGDVLLNYRYQLLAGERTAVSPRLSLILPTGDADQGLGDDSPGLQVNLPVSHRLAGPWIVHANLGASWLAEVEEPGRRGRERGVLSPFAGASLIWLRQPTLNVMLEWLTTWEGAVEPGGSVSREAVSVLSPGLRWAINRGDLQIVPGVALPLTYTDGDGSVGVFLYLSFEHPF